MALVNRMPAICALRPQLGQLRHGWTPGETRMRPGPDLSEVPCLPTECVMNRRTRSPALTLDTYLIIVVFFALEGNLLAELLRDQPEQELTQKF